MVRRPSALMGRRMIPDIANLGDPADTSAVGAFHLHLQLSGGLDFAPKPKHVIDLHVALVAAFTPEIDGVVAAVREELIDSAGHPENIGGTFAVSLGCAALEHFEVLDAFKQIHEHPLAAIMRLRQRVHHQER